MTVAELIAKLQKLPENAIVIIPVGLDYYGMYKVIDVKLDSVAVDTHGTHDLLIDLPNLDETARIIKAVILSS